MTGRKPMSQTSFLKISNFPSWLVIVGSPSVTKRGKMSQEPQEDAGPTPSRGPALLTQPSVCDVTGRALPEFSASNHLKGHDLKRLQGWAGSDIRHPTTNSKARSRVARRRGQGTPAGTVFPSGSMWPRPRGAQCCREPKHFREADDSRAHGKSLLLYLGNEFQLFRTVCRSSTM